jgi:phosphate:Na+ symporter
VDLYERKYRLPAMKKGFEEDEEIDPSFAENHATLMDIMNAEDAAIIDEALDAAGVKSSDNFGEKVKEKVKDKVKKNKSKDKDKKEKKDKSKKSKGSKDTKETSEVKEEKDEK